jgi:hypothetical protein
VKDAYTWGWTLAMFMESHYGSETVRRIVSTCADGDVFRTAGIDRKDFEQAWKKWLSAAGEIGAEKDGR